jgi:hypothetical protein
MDIAVQTAHIVQIEPQNGNNCYLRARRRGALYRTRYNIHSNFTTDTDGTTKGKQNMHHLHVENRHVISAQSNLENTTNSQKTLLLIYGSTVLLLYYSSIGLFITNFICWQMCNIAVRGPLLIICIFWIFHPLEKRYINRTGSV